jgi:hypothetical protein
LAHVCQGGGDDIPIIVRGGAGKTIRDTKGLTALDYARKLKADDATLRILQ